MTGKISIGSDPPEAQVWGKAYSDPDGEWQPVGRTPLESVRFPSGASRLRVELAGHVPADDLLFNIGFKQTEWNYTLQPEGEIPEEMVHVPGGEFDIFLPGLDHLTPEPVAGFLMDRHEVTHREFKAFVDAGGYENPELWPQPMVHEGRELTFEEGHGPGPRPNRSPGSRDLVGRRLSRWAR